MGRKSNKDFIKIIENFKYLDKCGFFLKYNEFGNSWYIMVTNDTSFNQSFYRFIDKHMNENHKKNEFMEHKHLFTVFGHTSYSNFKDEKDLGSFLDRAKLDDNKKEEIWETILTI